MSRTQLRRRPRVLLAALGLTLACAEQHAGQDGLRPDAAGEGLEQDAAAADAAPAGDASVSSSDAVRPSSAGASSLTVGDIVEAPAQGCARRLVETKLKIRAETSCEHDGDATCNLSVTCTDHEECPGPLGICHALVVKQCSYPGSDRGCREHADCAGLPSASCSPPAQRCYGRGRCEPADRRCVSPALELPCQRDADCTALPGGACSSLIRQTYCSRDGCDQDSHCAQDERCTCTRDIKRCVPSQCRADADCQPGQRCITSSACGDLVDGFYCTTTADTCASDADCSGLAESSCTYGREQRWTCQPTCIVDTLD